MYNERPNVLHNGKFQDKDGNGHDGSRKDKENDKRDDLCDVWGQGAGLEACGSN